MSTERMNKNCDVDPELWLDFVEGELDASFAKDLKAHSETCVSCRQNLNEFSSLKTKIRQTEKLKMPDELSLKRLENKIIDRINELPQSKTFWPKFGSQTKVVAMATAAVCVLVFGSLFLGPELQRLAPIASVDESASLEDQWIAQNAAQDPDLIEEVLISHQDSDDLVFDAAAYKLSRMSDKEVRAMLGQKE